MRSSPEENVDLFELNRPDKYYKRAEPVQNFSFISFLDHINVVINKMSFDNLLDLQEQQQDPNLRRTDGIIILASLYLNNSSSSHHLNVWLE